MSGFARAPFNDIEALKAIAQNNRNVVAILVEPVQGEGGINIPDAGYLKAIRDLCDEHDWLMMLDEIQSGMARSGKLFAFQHEGITPDVMTLAKALGNGVPIGACLAAGKAVDLFQPGNHGSTFGGNPFVSFVAHAVLKTMLDENLADQAAARGEQLTRLLQQQLSDDDGIIEIRHLGLLVGISMNRPCGELVNIALQNRLLINVTADNVIRLLPPLTMTEAHIEELAKRLVLSIQQFNEQYNATE